MVSIIKKRMSYKPDDLNYKMTDFELKVIESKKMLLGENVEENGSEAISFDSEVNII
tara:strand:+ start:410 stop:580 length:171 start_codon:yes stop_codon:yes gene_type:complete